MNREEILKTAHNCVCKDREGVYGGPEENFETIAAFWSIYLKKKVTAKDVASLMILMKTARLMSSNHESMDSWVDIAGYASCGGEIASNEINKRSAIIKDEESNAPTTFIKETIKTDDYIK